jgi:hypothetical protein
MNKVRYKEIELNEYEVILPDYNNELIGKVYLDPFKKPNQWFIETNFLPFWRDDKALKLGYEDFTKAGRALVDIYEYTLFLTKDNYEDEIDNYFMNLKP